ncbi:MAG: hypothetical protein CVV64_10185 [Candidatus Wallbacteria bacterium HGW-Wallbacteria-1]|jgi:tRNA A37 methylthiotransferase MiaB|uniref:Uncharacterized protein n=1 Tax=Candidatus Wallbacteria bacterium HGW-Wallbacteria-1 TaxID=2013854 RepID=A0A2N1PPR5_9BACT|nr:MAG: hypothetical protein CVV64_10185 [Candidatus Wallbacteria bacterium HGW-Wallbacteria-1]
MKTFWIMDSTHPCTELLLDVSRIREYLEGAGFSEIKQPRGADLIVIATCAYNQEHEQDAIDAIKKVREIASSDTKVIVTGCLSRINPELYSSICSYDALPPMELERMDQLIPSSHSISEIVPNSVRMSDYARNPLFMKGITLKRFFRRMQLMFPGISIPVWLDTVPMDDWFFIRGSTGCTGTCSYCAIKRARGQARSTSIESVVSQVEQAVMNGYREISLAGDDMGCYGVDTGSSLAELLNEILRVSGDFTVNIRFIEPLWLLSGLPDLYPHFKSGRITSFCVPLQSGSQKILNSMNRKYDIREALAGINYVLEKTAVRSISSIVMVGFPSETRDDFRLSMQLLDKCGASLYQILKYEGRPGTASEAMEPKISEVVKSDRQKRFAMKMKLMKFSGFSSGAADFIVQRIMGEIQ